MHPRRGDIYLVDFSWKNSEPARANEANKKRPAIIVTNRAVCKYVVALCALTSLQTARCFHSVPSKMVDEKAVNHFEICPNSANINGSSVVVIPLSGNTQTVYPFQVLLSQHRTNLELDSKAQTERKSAASRESAC